MTSDFFSYINPDVVPTLQSPSSDPKANGRVGVGSLKRAKNRPMTEREEEESEEVGFIGINLILIASIINLIIIVSFI